MKQKLTFNLADREKHMESLKKLYGDSDVKETENRQEADSRPENAGDNPKRVRGM